MHKASTNGGENKFMNIYEVLNVMGFGNMRTGCENEFTHAFLKVFPNTCSLR